MSSTSPSRRRIRISRRRGRCCAPTCARAACTGASPAGPLPASAAQLSTPQLGATSAAPCVSWTRPASSARARQYGTGAQTTWRHAAGPTASSTTSAPAADVRSVLFVITTPCLLPPYCCLAACTRCMRRAARQLGRCARGSQQACAHVQQKARLMSGACSASAWVTQRLRWRTLPSSRAGACSRRHRAAVAADASPSQARVGCVPRRLQGGFAARRWRGRLHLEPRRRARAGVRSSRVLRAPAT